MTTVVKHQTYCIQNLHELNLMSGLQIDISPGSTYSAEGDFGQVSFNGLANFPSLNEETRNIRPPILTYPVLRMEALGQGSSSIVYKAVMLHSLQVTAEKVFVIHDSQKRLQLFRELESLKSLCNDDGANHTSCPFLVNLLEVYSNPTDGTLSMCLDYMDCGSLQQLINRGGCADETALASIAYQMTSGLKYLHDRRLIHRDVKPSNALISSNGRIKLADFGLARTLDSGQSLATSFVGTFLYMAPERLTGESYSFQSDIWSLGLTIHAVAMGAFPYVGKTGYWEVLHATQQGPPPISPRFSPQLRAFLATTYLNLQHRASAESLLSQPFLSGKLASIPESLRQSVCIRGPPAISNDLEDPIIAQANQALAARIAPTASTTAPKTAPKPPQALGRRAVDSRTVSTSNATKASTTRKGVTPGNVLTSNTRTPVANKTQSGRQTDRFGSTKATVTASSTSKKPAPNNPVTTVQSKTPCKVATTLQAPKVNVMSVQKKGPFVRSVSAVGIQSKKGPNAMIIDKPMNEATKSYIPLGTETAAEECCSGPEITTLVQAWVDYVTQARKTQSDSVPQTGNADEGTRAGVTPAGVVQDNFNYAASPSAAVNSLRRLVSRQHDVGSVQVISEDTVRSLATALDCDCTHLWAAFRAALKVVNQGTGAPLLAIRVSSNVRSSTAPAMSALRASVEEPVRTLGDARRSMRFANNVAATNASEAPSTELPGPRTSIDPSKAAMLEVSMHASRRNSFLASPVDPTDAPNLQTPAKTIVTLAAAATQSDSASFSDEGEDEHEEILDEDIEEELCTPLYRAHSGADPLDESISEELEGLCDIPSERVLATALRASTLSNLTVGNTEEGGEGEDEEENSYADESFEDFHE